MFGYIPLSVFLIRYSVTLYYMIFYCIVFCCIMLYHIHVYMVVCTTLRATLNLAVFGFMMVTNDDNWQYKLVPKIKTMIMTMLSMTMKTTSETHKQIINNTEECLCMYIYR